MPVNQMNYAVASHSHSLWENWRQRFTVPHLTHQPWLFSGSGRLRSRKIPD